MIAKTEVMELAGEWNLRPEVVEKDYVLGWVLVALSQLAGVRDQWVLKGGTCVKKCFFETYRFSEDLDFTLAPDAPYDADVLAAALRNVATRAGELSGIRFNLDDIVIKRRHDRLDRPTFEGRLGYQGPLVVPTWPRIRFDITRHEAILVPTTLRTVLHPYTDGIPAGTSVHTYAFEELLAEKTRALFERTRPRDLYDVAYILDNLAEPLNANLTRTTFAAKCRAKNFEPPTATEIVERVRGSEELRADWGSMLDHQLPYVTPVDGAIERLSRALAWLADQESPQLESTSSRLDRAPVPASAGVVLPGTMHGSVVDRLRFAGANRLLVEFTYSGRHRTVEPYSLRWAKTTGNLNFYGWELASGQVKAFTVSKMFGVAISGNTFTPRYQVELGTPGAFAVGIWRP